HGQCTNSWSPHQSMGLARGRSLPGKDEPCRKRLGRVIIIRNTTEEASGDAEGGPSPTGPGGPGPVLLPTAGDRPVQRALPGPLPGGGSGLGGGPPGPGGWDGPPAGGGWRGSEALIVFHRCRRGVPGRETCRENREVVIRLRPEKRAGPPL